MTADRTTRAAVNQSGGAPTAGQPTTFDARDVLAGETDDTTVKQAAKACSAGSNPRVNGCETGVQNTKTSDSAGVGQ